LKTYYELLELPPTAAADDIKKAFRREIAKYHPDKVQHLGEEFQQIAVVKAAELTQAYKTLSDPATRAEYDAELGEADSGSTHSPAAPASTAHQAKPSTPSPTPPRPAHPSRQPAEEPNPGGAASIFAQDRAGAMNLINRATLARFRYALEGEFGRYEEPALQGFQIVCVPKPPFWSLKLPPRILGRFLPHVDGAAVSETWALAAMMKKDPQRDLCVFVMAPTVAAPGELAVAIAEQRRRPMPAGGKLIMIPVNTQTWNAHVPTDAPPVVKSLLTRLKSA
jgi:curved DNA-binding protein CbpA